MTDQTIECKATCAQVTTQLLLETQAGKQIKKLIKHSDPAIAKAAGQVVEQWKNTIKSEASGASPPVTAFSRPV